jgi:hypothetical protein
MQNEKGDSSIKMTVSACRVGAVLVHHVRRLSFVASVLRGAACLLSAFVVNPAARSTFHMAWMHGGVSSSVTSSTSWMSCSRSVWSADCRSAMSRFTASLKIGVWLPPLCFLCVRCSTRAARANRMCCAVPRGGYHLRPGSRSTMHARMSSLCCVYVRLRDDEAGCSSAAVVEKADDAVLWRCQTVWLEVINAIKLAWKTSMRMQWLETATTITSSTAQTSVCIGSEQDKTNIATISLATGQWVSYAAGSAGAV